MIFSSIEFLNFFISSTILSAYPSRNSSNLHQGFSLPTAKPRQNRLNSSLPRSPTKSQQPSSLPTEKIDTSKYQHLLLPMPVLRGQQTKRQGKTIVIILITGMTSRLIWIWYCRRHKILDPHSLGL